MTSPALIRTLRRPRLRQRLVLLAACAVFIAGIAHAAHFHRDELAQGRLDLHPACLLCMHADRAAPPPQLPEPPRLAPARCLLAAPLTSLCPSGRMAGLYRARAPPAA